MVIAIPLPVHGRFNRSDLLPHPVVQEDLVPNLTAIG